MLKFLSIKNLAVIHQLSLSLHEGLNLLTGETGAGKSIIVDALELLLGGRGGGDLIRTGERAAVIEGLFELAGGVQEKVREILSSVGVELEKDGELLIRREIQSSGRSRIFVNDRSVTGMTLRTLQPALLEILGQGEQHTLGLGKSQLEMLDSFAGCYDLRLEVGRAYDSWKRAVEAFEALERDESERERSRDFLRYQISEIEKTAPHPDEDYELTAKKTLLAHAEKAFELCAGGYAELYESDQSVLTRLAAVRRRVQELLSIDERVSNWLEALETATLMITDVAEGLRRYGSDVDFSPGRLDSIENRLAELERLKRKYGRDLNGLIRLKEDLSAQLNELDFLEERRSELAERMEAAAGVYLPLAERLSLIRRTAAKKLEARVMEELAQLALERARFIVSVETSSGGEVGPGENSADPSNQLEAQARALSFCSPTGADRVEFFLAANVGEDARPLARVASGGELSRLMLTLRFVCGDADAAETTESDGPSMVFDEVDTGIGGKTAETVGRRLKALAVNRQVLCVTHQAQIARFADHHYVVTKSVEEGRTSTRVQELAGEERVGELARMIGGSGDIETARATARWMLEDKDRTKNERRKSKVQEQRPSAKKRASKILRPD